MLGGAGDDQFYANDGEIDTISGGAGNDLAIYDSKDVRTSIQGLIT